MRTGDDDVEMQSIFGGGDTVSSRAPFSVPANTVVGESVGDGGDGGAAGGAGQLRSPESSQKQPQLQQQEELLKTPPSTKRTHHVFSGNNQQQQQLHTPVSGSGLGERDERSSTTLLALTSSQKRPRMTWQPPGTPTPAPRMGLGVVGEVGSVGGGPRSSFTVQGVQDTPSKAWTTSFTTVNNDDDPFTAADVGPDHEQTQHILGLLIPSYSSLPLDGGEGNLTIDPPITRASLAAARAALNALARRADGYVRGRDSARDALRRRDARIAEMQGRLVELERKLALEREVVRRLIEEAGRAAVSAERAGGGSRAGDGDSGDQGNGGGDGEEIAMQDSYGSTEARQ